MNEVAKVQVSSELVTEVNAAAMQELFVINLCASMTPMPSVPKNLEGFEKYKLYQVSRQEDGRRRFRLRLGFFTSEADAEWVLNSVRNLYPAAFTGCITQEDMRYAAEVMPGMRVAPAVVAQTNIAPVAVKTEPAKPVQSVKAATPAAAPAAKAIAAKPAAKIESPVAAMPRAAAPVAAPVSASVAPVEQAALTLSASTPVSHASPTASTPNHAPFHVGRGVDLPETTLELTNEYPALSASTPAAKVEVSQPKSQQAAPTAKPASPSLNKPAASKPNIAPPANSIQSAHLINPPKIVDDYVPILDTTLTIRTLTTTEAEDPNRPKWFAVQLALSEQPVNLETMPKLDIFAAYSLYSVTVMEGHSIKHALRLGFFRETVSADAVMGYLKAFFGSPSVTQISSAEYDRFAEAKPKPKPAPEPAAKVVNLSEKRPAAVAPAAAAKTAPRPVANSSSKPGASAKDKARMTPPPARPQSFLSRLIGRQLD